MAEGDSLRSAWDARDPYWHDTFGPLYARILDAHISARSTSYPLRIRSHALALLADEIRHFILLAEPFIEPDGLERDLEEARAAVRQLLGEAREGAVVESSLQDSPVEDPRLRARRLSAAIHQGADLLLAVFRRANMAAAKSGLGGPVVKTQRVDTSGLVEAIRAAGNRGDKAAPEAGKGQPHQGAT